MNLDHHLKGAFKRHAAPPDFAQRVLARLDEHLDEHRGPSRATAPAPPPASRRAFSIRWLAAAAVLVLAAAGTAQHYVREQAAAKEAVRVQSEIRLALRITGEKLALVQHRLQESHR